MSKTKKEKPYQIELDKAWKEFGENNFENASKLANKIITEHSDAIGAFALIAHIDFENDKYEESVNKFKKCLDLDKEQKNHGYFYYWIGRVYDYYGFDSKNSINERDKANVFFEKALEHNNYPPDSILRVLRNKTNSEEEILLLKGIKEFPNFITFYARLFSNSKIENNSSLLEILKKGYSNTKSYTIGFLIGKYYEENQKYDEAISNYNICLNDISNDSEKKYFYESLGSTYFKSGKFDESLEFFRKASDTDNGNFSTISILQALYISLLENNKSLAIEYLEKLRLEEDFFQIDLNNNLVWMESEYPIAIKHILDFKVFEKKLRELRKEISDDRKDMVSQILVIIFKNNSKFYDRFRILKQLVNDYSQDYILDEYINAYSDYFEFLKESKKDIKNFYSSLINDISNSFSIKDKLVSSYTLKSIIEHLFSKEDFWKITCIGNLLHPDEISKVDFWFELAYSFGETGDKLNARKAYETEIEINPESSASYNNLSIIYEKNEEFNEALKCISEARKLEPDKELYERNFNRIKQLVTEENQRKLEFEKSTSNLENETDFAISKLSYFINTIKSDSNYTNNSIPIANWMFPKLIGANKELANSLKEQWLDKGYISKTNERTENNVIFYSLNPFIENAIEKTNACKVDEKWVNGFSAITKDALVEINYPDNILRISKINKKYRGFILRDYKELCINYLLKNEKATLILAGSLTEYLLIYYCEKKKIQSISYLSHKGKTITKKLYDCVLDDLIKYFETENILKADFFHLNNLARIYRNYVHPGKELRDSDELSINKAKICFIGVSELLNKIV